jgi:hypothetical protein
MRKHSLLEQLRTARDNREREATEPLATALRMAESQADNLHRALKAIEKLMGSEMAANVKEQIAHELSRAIHSKIREAFLNVDRRKASEVVTISLPRSEFLFADPRSIEARLLARYLTENVRGMSVRVKPEAEACVSYLDIQIPPLAMRQAIYHS